MPKTGLSPSEWEERLQCLANSTFKFRRGQRPPPGSKIAKKVSAIENCPSQGSFTGLSVLGTEIPCKCGYHKRMDLVRQQIILCILQYYTQLINVTVNPT